MPLALPRRAALSGLGLAHLLAVALLGRLRVEHLALDGLLVLLPWLGARAAAFAAFALPLWLAGVLMDSQPLYLGLRRAPIHTGDLRDLERALFSAGGVSWSEWLAARPHPALDLLTGLAYATYLAEYFGVLLYFYVADRPLARRFAWGFLVANVVGVVGYLVYPAAPPWYVAAHGPGPADPHAVASAAGAARFDALLGVRYFASFYARNPNVFGAMPSLHAAYPVLVAALVWGRGRAWRLASAAFAALVAFAALYLEHHYLLDVIAGWAVAALSVVIVSRALRPATS